MISNHHKLLLVKSHGSERYGKGEAQLRQVCAMETNANEPLLTCRNSMDAIKTRG